ncbi:MAG: hypothetical protein ACLUOI_18540 [Eisenbergiella sp.]
MWNNLLIALEIMGKGMGSLCRSPYYNSGSYAVKQVEIIQQRPAPQISAAAFGEGGDLCA